MSMRNELDRIISASLVPSSAGLMVLLPEPLGAHGASAAGEEEARLPSLARLKARFSRWRFTR